LIPECVKRKIGDVCSFYTMLPSYFSSFPTLTRYSRHHESYRGSVRPELLDVSSALDRLYAPVDIPKATKEDLMIAKVTEETHPGIVTRYAAKTKMGIITRKATSKRIIRKKDVLHSVLSDVSKN